MKTRLLLLPLFFFITITASAQEGHNYIDTNGKKQGHWIYRGKDRPSAGYPTNGVLEEGRYIDDRKVGLWIRYYNDGVTIKMAGTYKNNRPIGSYYKVWGDGSTREVGYFARNKYRDTLLRFHENGQLSEYAIYNEKGQQTDSTFGFEDDGCLIYCYYSDSIGVSPITRFENECVKIEKSNITNKSYYFSISIESALPYSNSLLYHILKFTDTTYLSGKWKDFEYLINQSKEQSDRSLAFLDCGINSRLFYSEENPIQFEFRELGFLLIAVKYNLPWRDIFDIENLKVDDLDELGLLELYKSSDQREINIKIREYIDVNEPFMTFIETKKRHLSETQNLIGLTGKWQMMPLYQKN